MKNWLKEGNVITVVFLMLWLAVFALTFAILNMILPKKQVNLDLAKRAQNFLLSDYELVQKKEGWLVSKVVEIIPRLENITNTGFAGISNLRRMIELLGAKKSFEHVVADFILKSALLGGLMVAVPVITGVKGYLLLAPVGFIVVLVIQYRSVFNSYKAWQNELVKDLPLLIDKIQISLEAGKPILHALQQVYKTASPRLKRMLEKLILDMQIMKQTEAMDRFARATGIPEMLNFSATVKISIENGYEKSRKNFEMLKHDIRKLRVISLNEMTRNKPENLRKLQLLMALNAAVAMGYTFFTIFKEVDKSL